MSRLIRKTINEIRIQRAVNTLENLPEDDNTIRDTRYVKNEDKYYIFTGYKWQELDLIIQ